MIVDRRLLLVGLFLVTLAPALSFAEESVCLACDLIEKEGNNALPELQKMSYRELSAKDSLGATPFYWSLFHGHNEIRDFLLTAVKKEDLLSSEKGTELFEACANNTSCTAKNLEVLQSLGFKPGSKALILSVTGTQECSLKKFKLIKKMTDDFSLKSEGGFNLLHQIADRSRSGRPWFSRECLSAAIGILSKDASRLKAEKNKDGYTPLQLATYYRNNKTEWGSGIKKADLDPIVKALR